MCILKVCQNIIFFIFMVNLQTINVCSWKEDSLSAAILKSLMCVRNIFLSDPEV